VEMALAVLAVQADGVGPWVPATQPSTTRRLAMAPPHEPHHLPAVVIYMCSVIALDSGLGLRYQLTRQVPL